MNLHYLRNSHVGKTVLLDDSCIQNLTDQTRQIHYLGLPVSVVSSFLANLWQAHTMLLVAYLFHCLKSIGTEPTFISNRVYRGSMSEWTHSKGMFSGGVHLHRLMSLWDITVVSYRVKLRWISVLQRKSEVCMLLHSLVFPNSTAALPILVLHSLPDQTHGCA